MVWDRWYGENEEECCVIGIGKMKAIDCHGSMLASLCQEIE